MSLDARSPRERILETAAELFYERGFHAVGVDLIIQRAGVAKTTLYRHFPSKDHLIVAWLEHANEDFQTWCDAAIAIDGTAVDRMVHLFDAVEKLATSPTCLGCTFQVTAAEFPEPGKPAHSVALVHKEQVRGWLRGLADDAGSSDPNALADALLLLLDGAFAAARMYGPVSPAAHVAEAARTLIYAATPAP